jgi:oxygen-independent coproporphyrinogen-3 oxidase
MHADTSDAPSWDYLPEYARESLPRYTSYPPANRFTDQIGANDARVALSALGEARTLSIYVHIPYCRKLCWYCGCHTSVPTRADPLASYLASLLIEIDQVADAIAEPPPVAQIHLGGGSPDTLAPSQIDALLQTIRNRFTLSPGAEIAAELDPRGVTPQLIVALAANGLTRASLGVQDINEHVQQRINRVQPRGTLERAFRLLRNAGVAGVNMDLMYGLPGQSIADVERTAAFAIEMGADRVAVFGYAHLPWFKKHQKAIDASALPGSEERIRQAEAAARIFVGAGYEPVGFDHFARRGDNLATAAGDGSLRRNFQGYTTDTADALIGIGASAISSLPGLFYQNTPDTKSYKDALARNTLPVTRGVRVSAADTKIGALIERLLCAFEVEEPAVLDRATADRLDRLIAERLIARCGTTLRVTDRGRPYVRNIAATFDPGFVRNASRHSLAI